jgi:hypothetical protein
MFLQAATLCSPWGKAMSSSELAAATAVSENANHTGSRDILQRSEHLPGVRDEMLESLADHLMPTKGDPAPD